MTQFGVLPSSTSPAAKRLYEAGRHFAVRRLREAYARLPRAFPNAETAEVASVEESPISATPTMREILCEISAKHKIGVLDILSDRRSHPIVLARQEFMFRAKAETLNSLSAIARFCRRDHTTVMHGVNAHAKRMREAG